MTDPLNYILTEVLAADTYGPAATLGPIADVIDGIDVRVERADAIFQVAKGGSSDLSWLESREYTMRPGSRFIGNIGGIRFRNAVAGAQALITAAVTGPDEPRIGPLIPLPATGIGNPLLQLESLPAAGATFGPFDVGDWPALFLGALALDTGQGIRLSALYPAVFPAGLTLGAYEVTRSLDVLNTPAHYTAGPPVGVGGLVVENLASQVTISVGKNGVGDDAHGSIYVAPCNFSRHQLIPPVPTSGVTPETLLNVSGNVGAGASVTYLVPPFKGVGSFLFVGTSTGANQGPWKITLSANDFQDQQLGPETFDNNGGLLAAGTSLTAEIPLLAVPAVLTVRNTGTALSSFLATIVIKESS